MWTLVTLALSLNLGESLGGERAELAVRAGLDKGFPPGRLDSVQSLRVPPRIVAAGHEVEARDQVLAQARPGASLDGRFRRRG